MTRYSEEFKTTIINKILSPETKSIRSVANENGLPIATVLNWLKQKNIEVPMKKNSLDELKKLDSEYSALAEKFNIILETASLTPEELSVYCRQKGIYTSDIEIWKQEMLDNLDCRNRKELVNENTTLKIRLKELKSELDIKEKALAESAALLLLKKKARIIWTDQEEER